jgi:hypothetical protein
MPKDAYLVQILLPLRDNAGAQFGRDDFEEVSAELTEKFGGTTAFVRSPAQGLWEKDKGKQRDEVVIIETMVQALDADWWRRYRERLEKRFRQESIVVRSQAIRTL